MDALIGAKDIDRFVNTGALHRRDFCLLISVGLKDAFNSAPWKGFIRAMRRKNIDPHLIHIIKSYFADKTSSWVPYRNYMRRPAA